MCGVTILFGKDRQKLEALAKDTYGPLISRRGPDSLEIVTVPIGADSFVVIVASVLWIRGKHMERQPVVRDETTCLTFNGEVYGIVDDGESDTNFLMNELCSGRSDPVAIIAALEGPFALTFLDGKRLYFARNSFGQRSLLLGMGRSLPGQNLTHEWDHTIGEGAFDEEGFVLTSVVPSTEQNCSPPFLEVPASGIFCMDLEARWCRQVGVYRSLASVAREPGFGTQDQIRALLSASVYKRCAGLTHVEHVAVLFSGGIDCLLVVCFLHQHLDPKVVIRLKIVSFGAHGECYDRTQARATFLELEQRFPKRRFELIDLCVEWESVEPILGHVASLTYPQTTLMDVTIGLVLHFAYNDDQMGKVVFTGLGADELFGGYKRHASKWKYDPTLLSQELLNDISRIAYRNNGRDDRVAGNYGREVRHPFLDGELVNYVLQCDLGVLLDFDLGDYGGKLVLRSICRDFGFSEAIYNQPKKAMQFGSNVNKLLKKSLGLQKLDGRMRMRDLIK